VALALLGPLVGALTGAFAQPDQRLPATLTLVTTASGIAAFGIGAAFWGLLVGLLAWGLDHLRRRRA
jgi:benzoate membrane transport protein